MTATVVSLAVHTSLKFEKELQRVHAFNRIKFHKFPTFLHGKCDPDCSGVEDGGNKIGAQTQLSDCARRE